MESHSLHALFLGVGNLRWQLQIFFLQTSAFLWAKMWAVSLSAVARGDTNTHTHTIRTHLTPGARAEKPPTNFGFPPSAGCSRASANIAGGDVQILRDKKHNSSQWCISCSLWHSLTDRESQRMHRYPAKCANWTLQTWTLLGCIGCKYLSCILCTPIVWRSAKLILHTQALGGQFFCMLCSVQCVCLYQNLI